MSRFPAGENFTIAESRADVLLNSIFVANETKPAILIANIVAGET
ncbi:hypothetical protein [Ferrimonas sp. SCSIO 43195]|nr:hypothetical protein [Ferrimonas sp. SCSIO 43195]